VADAQFAALEQIQNPQAGAIRKRPKDRLGLGLSSLDLYIRLGECIGFLALSQELNLEKPIFRNRGAAVVSRLASGAGLRKPV
jgi:hypothetical protein